MLYLLTILILPLFLIIFLITYKYYAVKKIIKNYPPFGGCAIEIKFSSAVNPEGDATGAFWMKKRLIQIAFWRPRKLVLESYLHERRHSEQAFGEDEYLNTIFRHGMYEIYYATKKEIDEDELYKIYYNTPHEIDAREWASKEIKRYLYK